MLVAKAPAKINLILEVLDRRAGYHEIASVVQTVDLYDVLRFTPADGISFECTEPALRDGNLAYRAAQLLKRETGYQDGAHIQLSKRIPWGTGLGGGSSDAACALLCLNRLWNVQLALPELARLGATLGADVPLFLYGGTTLIEGLGERVTELPTPHPTHFVLLVPPVPSPADKTKQLYGKLTADQFTSGSLSRRAVESIYREGYIRPELFYNAFEPVARDFFSHLSRYEAMLRDAVGTSVHLTGSGPCLFAVVHSKDEGARVCKRLLREDIWCQSVSSTGTQNPGFRTTNATRYPDPG